MAKIIKHKKLFLVTAIVVALVIGWNLSHQKSNAISYTTDTATKGTLITSVSASGNITSGNRLSITTAATGTVTDVYVKNGDKVTTGQKIAQITLDQDSLQNQASALASYLSAKNQLFSAQTNLYSLQNSEFLANQKFINDAIARNLDTTDPTYIEENALWLQAEANYKNQTNVISQAQASLTSAWLNYQKLSSTILSPSDGTVSDLSLAPGLPLVNQNSSSSNSNANTSQAVGTITLPNGRLEAVVDVSEIDSPNVQPGQKVTLTLDAYPSKTFTGKVLLINTNGEVSSGVTTYPATILLDTDAGNIYPNMAVTANIITSVKDNVILVPSAALVTTNGQTQVRELVNGRELLVNVTLGGSNDTQTEVDSGVKEGDTVITGTSSPSTSSGSGGSASPFSRIGGRSGGGFGGGAVRVIGRGG